MFIESYYKKEINFDKLINYLNENYKDKKAYLYSSIQFINHLNVLKNKEKNFKILSSKPKRANYYNQILGCDSYLDSLNLNVELSDVDLFLYIGDGNFHPYALLYVQENLEDNIPIVVYNPVSEEIREIEKNLIKRNIQKRKVNKVKFYNSQNIGVFISTKWGQEQRKNALKLKEKYKDKNFYFFIGDLFDKREVQNYPFIEFWINTACPRIGQDDIVELDFPLLNLKDVL